MDSDVKTRIRLGERFIICVVVPRSLFAHESPHGYFDQIGSSKRKKPPEMLSLLFQRRSQIRLQMFADQLAIFSPGGLPNSLSLDEIGERQFSRNELICTCLSRCPIKERFANVNRERIMDWRGEGVLVIITASGRLSGIDPEYRLPGDSELLLAIHSVPIENREKLREIAIKKPLRPHTTEVEPKTTEVAAKTTQATTQVARRTTEVTAEVKFLIGSLLAHSEETFSIRRQMLQMVGVKEREDFRKRYLSSGVVWRVHGNGTA